MKKIFLFILSILALAVILNSCEEKEDPFYTGVSIYVSKIHFYPLDQGLSGTALVSEPSITSLDVIKVSDNSTIGSVALSNGEGAYSFTKTQLGIDSLGESLDVKFLVQADDGPAARYRKISVNNPLTVTGPADIAPVDTTLKIHYAIKDDCTDPTSIEVTMAINSETPQVVAGTFDLLKDSIEVVISPDMSGDTLNYTLTFSNEYGTFSHTHSILVIIKRLWDFEGYDSWTDVIDPWTLVDLDGNSIYTSSSFTYPHEGEAGSWRIFDFEGTDPAEVEGWEANSGIKYALCMASVPSGDVGNDDWMISTGFDIEDGYAVKLYAKSITDAYGLERLIVRVRDNGTNVETTLTDGDYAEVPTDWTKYEFDLSDWAGKNVSIMIGCVSFDAYALFVDDFEIVTADGKSVSSPNNKPKTNVPIKDKVIK